MSPATSPTSNRFTSAELRFLVGGAWLPAADLDPATLLDGWLAADHLRCCTFQGGLFLDVDGDAWSDAGTVDELWMTTAWFRAADALGAGAEGFGPTAGPWEESQLVWRRDGDHVVLEDLHPTGNVSMRPIRVPLDHLLGTVGALRARFWELVEGARALAAERRAAAAGTEASRFAVVLAQLPEPEPEPPARAG